MKDPWFGAKRFGFGLGPRNGKGVLVVVAYMAVLAGGSRLVFALRAPGWVFPVVVVALTAALLAIALATNDGRPWRWRWGDDARRP